MRAFLFGIVLSLGLFFSAYTSVVASSLSPYQVALVQSSAGENDPPLQPAPKSRKKKAEQKKPKKDTGN